jgi:hypothetical protein
MSMKALLLVVVVSLVFVGGGIALVVFCFSGGEPAGNQTAGGGGSGKDSQGKDGQVKDSTPPPKKPKKPRSSLSRGQQAEVDKTVARGLTYLRSTQNADGTWMHGNVPNNPGGLTALAGLTLLECGARKDDPAIKKVADYLRQREDGNNKIINTYDVSLAILFLDRLNDTRYNDLVPKLALRLVAAQTASGGWTYTAPALTDADGVILASLLQQTRGHFSVDVNNSKLVLKPVDTSKLRLDDNKPIPANLLNLPVWGSDAVVGAFPDSDNSNTQFAVLALWAAKSRGVPVERALARVVARFHKTRNPDDSWGYQTSGAWQKTKALGGVPTAMTCSGLLGLAVGQGLVNEARGKSSAPRKPPAQQDPAIKGGLDFLAKQLGDPNKPWENASGAPLVDMYALWSVERVGVIFDLPKIGGKDWYAWGAEKLVANQKIDGDKGYWDNGGYPGENPITNTCFGLLFLKQVNLAKDLTSKLQLGGVTTEHSRRGRLGHWGIAGSGRGGTPAARSVGPGRKML